jgi:hypothetical protein
MAKGFCTCKRDFPDEARFHPLEGASWHYLCDKPVLYYALMGRPQFTDGCNIASMRASAWGRVAQQQHRETGTGWV